MLGFLHPRKKVKYRWRVAIIKVSRVNPLISKFGLQSWTLKKNCRLCPQPPWYVFANSLYLNQHCFGGGVVGRSKVNSCFDIKKWSHFHYMFLNLGLFFEKSADIFSRLYEKNTMDSPFTKLIVHSFSKHNFQIKIIIKL
jgi:hypothetical protein